MPLPHTCANILNTTLQTHSSKLVLYTSQLCYAPHFSSTHQCHTFITLIHTRLLPHSPTSQFCHTPPWPYCCHTPLHQTPANNAVHFWLQNQKPHVQSTGGYILQKKTIMSLGRTLLIKKKKNKKKQASQGYMIKTQHFVTKYTSKIFCMVIFL